jgi:hypothetical protein
LQCLLDGDAFLVFEFYFDTRLKLAEDFFNCFELVDKFRRNGLFVG